MTSIATAFLLAYFPIAAVLWPVFAIVDAKYLDDGDDIDKAVIIGLGGAFVWPLTLAYALVAVLVHLAIRKDQS